MSLTLKPIAHSEIGLVRKNNQDSGYVSTSLLLVADGMGGAAAGDLASVAVVRHMRHVNDTPVAGEAALGVLKTFIDTANTHIADLVRSDPDLEGMGTTLTGGVFDGEQIHLVHIGDSRAYLLSGRKLTRLTHDHSYVQSLIDEGKIGEEEALTHPHRSLLLRVINGQLEIQPDIFSVSLKAGDRLMFCSDGLCGLVDDDAIQVAMNRKVISDAMTSLIDFAHAAGGNDNITIVMADVVEVKPLGTPSSGATDSSEHTMVLPAEPIVQATQGASAVRYKSAGLVGAATDQHWANLLDKLRPDEPTEEHTATIAANKLAAVAEEGLRYKPSSKRPRVGIFLLIAGVLIGLGGASWTVYGYVSSQYYIGEFDDRVAIYQGLPGSIAGIDTSRLYRETDIHLSDLPYSVRDLVVATMSSVGLEQANNTVEELRGKSEDCKAERANRPPGYPTGVNGC